ncbi:MAG: hypothetical protein ABI443_08805 [Chthoniobacterales bacterium]
MSNALKKLPCWFFCSLVHPVISVGFIAAALLLPGTGTLGKIAENVGIWSFMINLPGLWIVRHIHQSTIAEPQYVKLLYFALMVFVTWAIIVVPCSWLIARLVRWIRTLRTGPKRTASDISL